MLGAVKALSFVKALPWIALALLALACAAYMKGRADGYAKSERTHQAAGIRDFVDAVKRAADVGARVAQIGEQLRAEVDASRQRETQTTRRVRTANASHPEFAAGRRPAEHDRLRREQLARIAEAAASR